MIAVGFGTANIEVSLGESMGGYADRRSGVSGELDPLTARALTFFDGQRRAVLIVCDLICVNVDLVAEIRSTVNADICWVTATHTHAGPETGCVPGGRDTPKHLMDSITKAAASAFASAVESEQKLSAHVGQFQVTGLGSRRAANPGERTAVPVDVVSFTESDGRTTGYLVNVPVHPTVLASENTLLSADLAGGIRRSIQEHKSHDGAMPWVVATTGAAGDISTRHTRPARSSDGVRELSQRMAIAMGTPAAGPTPLWSVGDASIITDSHRLVTVAAKSEKDIAGALPRLGGHRHTAAAETRTEYTRRQGIEIARKLLLKRTVTSYDLDMAALRIGKLTLVAVPGELFLGLGTSIKEQLGSTTTVVIGYANGYLGYLPDRASAEHPSYENFVSPVPVCTGEFVAAMAVEIGRQAQKGMQNP